MHFPLRFRSNQAKRRVDHDTALVAQESQNDRTPEETEAWCKSMVLGNDIMFPQQGVTWWAGETVKMGWTGGYDIKGKQSSTFSMEIRHFDAKYDKENPDTIKVFSNKTFHYPSSNWGLRNPECPDTWISYNWTIPEDFKVGDTKFVVWLFDTTEPNNETSMMSKPFFIDSNFTQILKTVSKRAPAAITSSPAQETIPSTPTSTLESTGIPQETTTASKGLSVGARAGIGAGVGLFILLLLLGGFFLYRYKKRQTPDTTSPGSEKPEVNRRTVRHAPSKTDRSEMFQSPDSALFQPSDTASYRLRASTIRLVSGSDNEDEPWVPQRIVYQINQDPIEIPAELLMSSPKASQEVPRKYHG